MSGMKPIRSWCITDDDGHRAQAQHLAQLPFIHEFVAVMADGQIGYGMPIGGVVALDGYISPSMVGMDIGCGMYAFKTSLKQRFIKPPQVAQIIDMIYDTVPKGKNWHPKCKYPATHHILETSAVDLPVVRANWTQLGRQLGTMGGNNHFIELQVDVETDDIWVMIHTGSRNLGKQVCTTYDGIAKELNQAYHSVVPAEWDLAFLPIKSTAGNMYYREMTFCLAFAEANRRLIAMDIRKIISSLYPMVLFDTPIDIHHNYAAWENHFGKNVIVHRKGAVKAKGPVIIPGCMESFSYICEGLNNPESFCSCSHGAGRTMSRGAAMRNYDAESIEQRLKFNGIYIRKPNMADIAQESVESYKSVTDVMVAQKELVKPIIKLITLGVVKG